MTRVLVVEDNPDLRLLVADILADAGYEVRSVGDGAEALTLLDQWWPAVIVLDLMMPVMDGEAFLQLRRQNPTLGSIPVLVVTAHAHYHRILDGLAPSAVLRKPYNLDDLLAKVAMLASDESTHGRAC
jgi:CheY-like chemotaxis protein